MDSGSQTWILAIWDLESKNEEANNRSHLKQKSRKRKFFRATFDAVKKVKKKKSELFSLFFLVTNDRAPTEESLLGDAVVEAQKKRRKSRK